MLIGKVGDSEIHWDGDNFYLWITSNTDKMLRLISKVNAELARGMAPMGKRFYTASAGKYGYTKTWKHRDPGTLKRSIAPKKSKFKGGGWVIVVREVAFYARWVEYGKPKGSAIGRHKQVIPYVREQPFLRPAIRRAQQMIETEMRRKIIPSDTIPMGA